MAFYSERHRASHSLCAACMPWLLAASHYRLGAAGAATTCVPEPLFIRHSSLGYVSPIEFERRLIQLTA